MNFDFELKKAEAQDGELIKNRLESAKELGYDPNNLPLCNICGGIPNSLSSAPNKEDVMIVHECERPHMNFKGPGHLWFLCEFKRKLESKECVDCGKSFECYKDVSPDLCQKCDYEKNYCGDHGTTECGCRARERG